jgi:SsuE family FMN reductase
MKSVRVEKQIEAAAALIVSTPIYKAAYTGALKALLDILPPAALDGKVVLPIATGGSFAHLLAIEYALKPVLSALGATDLLQGRVFMPWIKSFPLARTAPLFLPMSCVIVLIALSGIWPFV